MDGFGRSVSQKAVHAAKKYSAAKTNIKSGNINGHTFEAVNKNYFGSLEYKNQFKNLFDSPALNQRVKKYATAALKINDDKPSKTIYIVPTNYFIKASRIDKKYYWNSNDGVGETLLKQKTNLF